MSSEKQETTAAVRVLGRWRSPFVIRVLIALGLKGVDHELVEEAMGNKSELLLASNPVHKMIPVLLHHGRPVSESLIIVQYVDEAWSSHAPALLPSDPYARAAERFWAQYVDDKFPTAIRVLRGRLGGDKDEAAVQVRAALQRLEVALVECGGGKDYFGGDGVGYLDIALGSHLGWIRAVERIAELRLLDEAKVPKLAAWADRFCAHPAVADAMPGVERFVEFSVKNDGVLKAASANSK
ncbi:glutathione S-transferase U17-like [Hordeum vulgare]|nr:glutathione S-transferase U17-like [Hordeum vulgare]